MWNQKPKGQKMTNDKNDVYVKFAKNIPIALVCDGEKHSFQGLSETCVCGKEKANITRIEVGEIANQVSVADMLMAEGSKEKMDEPSFPFTIPYPAMNKSAKNVSASIPPINSSDPRFPAP